MSYGVDGLKRVLPFRPAYDNDIHNKMEPELQDTEKNKVNFCYLLFQILTQLLQKTWGKMQENVVLQMLEH
jgi:hypothetical protein